VELAPGTNVDRFRVEGLIGRGGMAAVYLVRHRQLGSLHALKVLAVPTPAIQHRLVQEGRAQSTLRHPHIVAVTDIIEIDGLPALVLEWVDGPSLETLLAAGPLDIAVADHLARGILRGVAAAHRAGFVHRDLKPANVLLATHDGVVIPKVADFGLTKLLDAPTTSGRTRSGAMMGTPAYMAPEQVRDAGTVDRRADVFSLGALLYELVSGEQAFRGDDNLALLTAVATVQIQPIAERVRNLPERMARAIDGALTAGVDDRWADADELLAAWSAGTPSPFPQIDTPLATDLAHLTNSLRSEGTPPDPASTPSGATFALSRGPVGQPETLESPTPTGPGMTLSAVVAGAASVPMVLGIIATVFGDLSTPFQAGGFVMWPLLATSALAYGVLGLLFAREQRGATAFAGWLTMPAILLVIGSFATRFGIDQLLGAAASAPWDTAYELYGRGVAIALTTDLTGLVLGAALLIGAATTAVASRRRALPRRLGPRVVGIALATLVGGTALWLGPALLGGGTVGGQKAFLAFASLVVVAIAAALVAPRRADDGLDRTRLLVLSTGVPAVLAAAQAVDVLQQLDRYSSTQAGRTPVDSLAAMPSFVAATLPTSSLAVAGWGLLALGICLVPLWGAASLPVRRVDLALAAVLALLVVGARIVERAGVANVATQMVRAHEQAAAAWYLGAGMVDTPAGPTVLHPGGGLLGGDRVVAVSGTPVPTTLALVTALAACDCARGGTTCGANPACVQREGPFDLSVQRGDRTLDVKASIGRPE
jgi:serine/threonine protein kinase